MNCNQDEKQIVMLGFRRGLAGFPADFPCIGKYTPSGYLPARNLTVKFGPADMEKAPVRGPLLWFFGMDQKSILTPSVTVRPGA